MMDYQRLSSHGQPLHYGIANPGYMPAAAGAAGMTYEPVFHLRTMRVLGSVGYFGTIFFFFINALCVIAK
ncbi:hypothetical protein CHARACLAT_025632 [Characodon lateralis]|uniref:Uncharacterized protein n=1 Tax=Characodon lateralis TaxID=208331 RepID=A0ABU7D1B2_9TELE|nr:hypothetical protein [Characodon lateralis]